MIPLSPSTGMNYFPKNALKFIFLLILLDLATRFWNAPREQILETFAFGPQTTHPWLKLISSSLLFPHIFSLLIHSLFFWAFAPLCIHRLGRWRFFLGVILTSAFSLFSFYWVHSNYKTPIIAPEALFAGILGMAMRFELWGATRTLVLGFGWLRVFDVPSYVLIFFYFFYLLLGNFFLPNFYTDAPMLYWIPFVSFLIGFAFAWLKIGHVEQDETVSES
ncbi:hypothetical protein GW915_02785 [bacterium]|nr:hypothetical protein [bacterium]